MPSCANPGAVGHGAFQVIASRLDDQVWHDDHLVGLAAARLTVL